MGEIERAMIQETMDVPVAKWWSDAELAAEAEFEAFEADYVEGAQLRAGYEPVF